MIFEIAIVVVLTIINGLLAMSELAVVSARPARLKTMADAGSTGAQVALRLADDPGRFLSTVQIGITLVGVLSGAFSGATLGARMAAWLARSGVPAEAADALGVGSVVVLITYLSLIIGELVPKQVALRDPERVASRVASSMQMISRVAAPLVWLLDRSGKLVLTLLGQRGEAEEKVTEEEIRTILAEAENAGVLESEEKAMMASVMRLADKSARSLMTPRRDVEVLDLGADMATIRSRLRATRRTRMPVKDGAEDRIIGVAFVRDLVEGATAGDHANLRALVAEVPVVNDLAPAFQVLKALQNSKVHMALVYDEYGHFEGVVTSSDVLEAITGSFIEEGLDEPAYVRREDGSLLVSGWTAFDTLHDLTGVAREEERPYETVAGFVLHHLHRLPTVGEVFEHAGWRFEVLDLDGHRIDKLLVTTASPPA